MTEHGNNDLQHVHAAETGAMDAHDNHSLTEEATMSEQNKAIAQRMIDEFWSQGRLELADELVAADHVIRDPATPGEFRGPEGLRQFASIYRTAFPDLRFTVETVVAEGDAVVQYWRTRGTQRGDLPGIPATGQAVEVTGITITRFRNGQMIEHNVVWDALGLLRQLGVAPAMAETAG